MTETNLFSNEEPLIAQQVQPTSENINAAIYVRTSPNSRDFREGYSIKSQIKTCWKRCESLGWTVTHIFRDIDESGRNPDRPKFQQMLDDAENGLFDVLVVWKLDRFSRSLMHAVSLESELRDYGVALHSVTEFIDTTTPSGRFNFRSMASAAELERELIKQRTATGRREAAEERKWPNANPPLGYSLDENNRLVEKSQESKLVIRIFKLYVELRSMSKVAQRLNDEGISTKEGNEWTARAVGDVLRNEIYIGRYKFVHVDTHVEDYQIIPDELFEQAKEIRYRFQSSQQASRESMDSRRKQKRIERIAEQYNQFLDEV